jgi:hypothetical protein
MGRPCSRKAQAEGRLCHICFGGRALGSPPRSVGAAPLPGQAEFVPRAFTIAPIYFSFIRLVAWWATASCGHVRWRGVSPRSVGRCQHAAAAFARAHGGRSRPNNVRSPCSGQRADLCSNRVRETAQGGSSLALTRLPATPSRPFSTRSRRQRLPAQGRRAISLAHREIGSSQSADMVCIRRFALGNVNAQRSHSIEEWLWRARGASARLSAAAR